MSVISLVNKFSRASINVLNKKKFFETIKIFLASTIIILVCTSFLQAAKKDKDKKDCKYCEKYETLEDWPESERPTAFIYEKFDYPEGMFTQKQKDSKKKQAAAGLKVYQRFVKNKGSLNKYQHLMIRDMAYFEALFNEMLNDKKANVETLEGLKKGREAMRMSLQISPKAKTSEAVLKFWATGKMLKVTWQQNKKKKKKSKIDPEIAERAAVLSDLKTQIATAKVNAQRAATIEAQKKIVEAK